MIILSLPLSKLFSSSSSSSSSHYSTPMASSSRSLRSCDPLLVIFFFFLEVMILISSVRSELFNPLSFISQRGAKEYCNNCVKGKESDYRVESSIQGLNLRKQDESVDITVTYVDASGRFKVHKVKSSDLSSSWTWQSSVDRKHATPEAEEGQEGSYQQTINKLEEINYPSTDQSQWANPISPVKLRRQQLRKKRKERRSAELIQMSKETELQMEAAAVLRTKQFKNTVKGKYSIWRKEYKPPSSDSIVKLMKDQIIMAKVYATIAASLKKVDIYDSLMKHVKESQQAIGVANSDAELQFGALEQAKAIGHALTHAKDILYDCEEVARKLQVMVQSSEGSIHATKNQNTFLIQHAAKTIPKTLHCLPLKLATDYFLHNHHSQEPVGKDKLVDNSLYHYAIFSDNVLAASVVVNSTVVHAKEPEKHVFHIVTDKLNYAAMKMWFIAYPPPAATVHVDNIDEFKWLNSSYCSVLRQLESNRIKEYYFKANHPSSLSAGNENLKYRNPKYLSMLNHLRFYMPEVYPKLDKILFLDDDIVVQKDLTPLWSIDMKGMVNGAVETCKESFHRFDTYLNFSNPKISENFDPQACGWAFGMNIFDLKEWKKRNITGIYHYWQDSNEDRKLWKLGSLPPGLITFYNLTYPLERNWHVLGLGYDPAVNTADIKEAAVVHYNGNYKPWLDLAISKYRKYWSKFVPVDNPYLQRCYIEQ